MAGIVRNDVDALIETQVANEIFEGTVRESKALQLFRRLPNATSDKTKIRVLDSLPVAYFVTFLPYSAIMVSTVWSSSCRPFKNSRI